MSELIGKTLGSYRILEQVGAGGMATIYKAYQPGMDRYVAIKVLPHYLANDQQFAKRFRREAQAIAKLEHPHILPVFDYGEHEGVTYIAMRYIEAGTLKEIMAQGQMSLDEISRIVGQVSVALDYAHRMGVVHRDVKPSNILIDAQGNTYLTDFGLARIMESSQQFTASGVSVGTPAYMSPEQGKGIKVDHRSDIYSLGVMLYEMVTGQVPYAAETPLAVLLKHITDPLPLPRTVKPDVPEAIELVILRALAKEPGDRFQSASELAQGLATAVRRTTDYQTSPAEPEPLPIKPQPLELAPETVSFITRAQQTWQTPRGKAAVVGATAVILILFGFLINRLNRTEVAITNRPPVEPTASLVAQVMDAAVPPSTKSAPTPAESIGVVAAQPEPTPTIEPSPTTIPPTPTSIWEDVDSQVSGALWLDGETGYVEVPYAKSLNLDKALTIEAWVKVEPRPSRSCPVWPYCNMMAIVSQSNETSSVGNYVLAVEQGLPLFGFEPDSVGDILFRADTQIDDGWHHLAVVHTFGQAAGTQLYLDGEPITARWSPGSDPNEPAFPNTRQPYLIGYITSVNDVADRYTNGPFQGLLDEVRIWNIARTEAEINATMKTELTGSEEGLVGYWKFNEPAGAAMAHDASPNGNDGALRGSAEIRVSNAPVQPPAATSIPAKSPTSIPTIITRAIPTASIIIDGAINDWENIEPIFVDEIDDEAPQANFEGTDIHEFYLAKDDTYLYVMITMYDGAPKTDVQTQYGFQADLSSEQYDSPGDHLAKASSINGVWYAGVHVRSSDGGRDIASYPSEYVGIGTNFIEWKVLLSDMGSINGRFVRVYIHVLEDEYPISDEIYTTIQLIDDTPATSPIFNPTAEQARAFAEPILAAATGRPPDYENDFDTPTGDWPSGTGVSGHPSRVEGEMGFDAGEYFATSNGRGCYGGDSLVSFPADFVLDITGRLAPSTDLTSDDDWQIQFRKWEFGGFYGLVVSQERGVGLVRHGPGEGEAVDLGNYPAPFQDVTQANRFQIIARGSETAVYVNGEPFFYANDSGYSGQYGAGTINLGVCNSNDAPLAARWDNLRIWDISE